MFYKEDFRVKKNFYIKGFTLVEMLIAISIVAVLSGIVFANFNNFRTFSNLDSDVEQLAAALRQTQLWALSGQTRNGVRPDGGWGMHLDECNTGNCKYLLFADLYPAGAPNYTYDAGNDEVVSEGILDKLVEVKKVEPKVNSSLDIVFTSPYADIYLNGSQTNTQGTITLRHTNSQNEGIITIDRISGKIEITLNQESD